MHMRHIELRGLGLALVVAGVFEPTAAGQTLLRSFAGDVPETGLGWSVAGGGDVDGDGTPDVLTGAILFDVGTLWDAGMVRVYSGSTGAVIHTILGTSAQQEFGHSVAFIGDINQDGKSDFLVGTQRDDTHGQDSGIATVYSGSDASILYQFHGALPGDFLGHSVASAGDVNADGVPDFMVGAVQWSAQSGAPSGPGYATVYSGSTGAALHKFSGVTTGDWFGSSVASAGDIDGDGRPDLMVGARLDDTTWFDSGSVSIFSGVTGTLLRFHAGADGDWLGMAVDSAGDVNGDGRSDYLISAPRKDFIYSDQGAVYLHSGLNGAVLQLFRGGINDQLGWSIATLGDVSGDGFPDFVFGSPSDSTHQTACGGAFVHSGANGQLLYQMNGSDALDLFGTAVAAAGDINLDGVPDMIVGAYRDNSPPGASDHGAVYVFSGACGPPATYCTAKTNSLGCVPTIYATGTASLTGPDDFFVRASDVINQKSGLLIWSFQPTAKPFMGGHLCVGYSIRRTPPLTSGGNSGAADCSGALAYRFTHNFLLSNAAPAGNTVFTQFHSRDPLHPDGTGVSLTGGLSFTVCP